MAKKSLKQELVITDVCLDVNGIIDIMFHRGVRKNLKEISNEMGYTDVAMYKLLKKAPKILSALHFFMKKNDLTFEQIVKEIPKN